MHISELFTLLGVRSVRQHDKGSCSIRGSVACLVRETEGAAAAAGECNRCPRTALAVLAAAAAATAVSKLTV